MADWDARYAEEDRIWSGEPNQALVAEARDLPPGTALDGNLTIACGDGAVRILGLQRAGKQAMTAEEFLRGTSLPAGTRVV